MINKTPTLRGMPSPAMHGYAKNLASAKTFLEFHASIMESNNSFFRTDATRELTAAIRCLQHAKQWLDADTHAMKPGEPS